MKINSHYWLRTAFQRLQCLFVILWRCWNNRRTACAALIRGRRLLTFPPHMRRLIEGGAYSGAALIRVNTVFVLLAPTSNDVPVLMLNQPNKALRKWYGIQEGGKNTRLRLVFSPKLPSCSTASCVLYNRTEQSRGFHIC